MVQNLKAKTSRVHKALLRLYPEAECELDFKNAYEVLIATVLSAQCTDVKVNQVTPALFKKYPSAKELATAKQTDVEGIIQSLGLYKNKAKNIIAAGKSLVENFNGEVPSNVNELITLAGVGRKTANCVLVNAFSLPGIMVDTHCIRVSNRLGLVDLKDAVKIEMALKELLPEKNWGDFSHRIILFGRRICHARSPECDICKLQKECDFFITANDSRS